MECCEVAQAVVRNNSVADACRSMPGAAAIQVDARISLPDARRASVPDVVNRDVTITANRILGPHGSAIAVSATRGLLLSDNKIEDPGAAAILLDRVEQAMLAGNACTPASTVELRGMTALDIKAQGNTGLVVRH